MPKVFSFASATMQEDIPFLLNPILLHGLSASFNLLSTLLLLLVWAAKMLSRGVRENAQEKWGGGVFSSYKANFFACLGLSVLNLFLCIFSYFFWNNLGWSEQNLAALLDLASRTISCLAVSAYLNFDFSYSFGGKYPIMLRVFWSFYFMFSCSFLLVDLLFHRKPGVLPTHLWFLDFGSVLFSSFICFTGFLRKRGGGVTLPPLQVPLLDGSGNVPSSKKCGKDSVTPFANANFFSILTFSWMGQLLKAGNAKELDLDDVPQLADTDCSNTVFHTFENKLNVCCNVESIGSNRGTDDNRIGIFLLVKALLLPVRRDVLLTALLSIFSTVSSYVGPYLIDTFVQYLSGRQEFENEGYALVSAFFISKLIECLSERQLQFRLQRVGIKTHASLVALLYKKGLSLSSRSKQLHTSGEVVNFMTIDAERVGQFSWYLHDLWLVPVQVTLALLILYKNLGMATLAALAATILAMLANIPLGKLQIKYQDNMMESKDTRMKAISEILRNMKILKLQGWEMKFLSKVIGLRKKEEDWLKKLLYTRATTTFIFSSTIEFIAVATFVSCILMGTPLESGKVLSALAIFGTLVMPVYNLPNLISTVVQTKVSLNRITSFLCLEDMEPDVVQKLPSASFDVEVIDGNFSWDRSSANLTLRDLNFKVLHGMRVAICGTVGSGKSSLLSCILGEIPKISGIIKLHGSRAYVPQLPWIQSGKIEENILFGKEMDRRRYDSVLEACALKKDLAALPFGDQTIIGERGINLSGGQKQRIQIARAIYHDADIFLFDDPFSAVDVHTGSHLFKECMLRLLSSKTVIYVTHQVEFLPAADLVLVMRNGKIVQDGKYNDILCSGTDFMELVTAHDQALSVFDSVGNNSDSRDRNMQSSSNSVRDGSSDTGKSSSIVEEQEKRDGTDNTAGEIPLQDGQLLQEEEREKGRVNLSVYWKYIRMAYKGLFVPLILFMGIMSELLGISSSYWMAWAAPASEDEIPPVTSLLLIVVYVAIEIGSSFSILVTSLLEATIGYKTATIIFNKMHMSVFRAPMSFFDSTPSGRILNRVSTDQSAVDVSIEPLMAAFVTSIILLLGTVTVMALVAWQLFIIFIPTFALCVWYQQYYIAPARELARLIGLCRAPCIQHFSESLSGSTTIKSFDEGSRFLETNFHLIDKLSRSKFHNSAAMEWLCFRLDILSTLTFALFLVFLVSLPKGVIDPGVAALAVIYGLNLNSKLAFSIWSLCNLENRIISVERIFQYMCIPSEPPLVIESSRPSQDWPMHGEVDIRELEIRYAQHMPLVLKGLTCVFPGGKKIGIVGRTGSGKSTLILALFRIVDPCCGQILIDGINIATIGLHDLRSKLSIIPQDPTMFEGTVRSNLDPLEEYSDEQIWEALDYCQLGEEVRRKEGKLDSAVTENGENWSMGQRQLVCLGRVLLKRSKVLVLDEATASVDTATDNLIQQTLRQQFSETTMITIAHRITSVLDSDMILLLDSGVIAESGSPSSLLRNESSLFAKLVEEYNVKSSSNSEGASNI